MSRYNLRPNPTQTGPTTGQIATNAVNDLTKQREIKRNAIMNKLQQNPQILQQNPQILQQLQQNPNNDDIINDLFSKLTMGGKRRTTKRRRTNKRRKTNKRRTNRKRTLRRRRY